MSRDVALRVEADVDTVEEQIFAPRSTTDIDQIYLPKREILELRRVRPPWPAVGDAWIASRTLPGP